MILERVAVEQRVLAALDATPPRIPWLLGASRSGRSSTLLRLHDALGPRVSQYVDIERSATTPERFFAALEERSPFSAPDSQRGPAPASAREAFDATLAFLERPHGTEATFLLDEALEFRVFESFPGLRHTLRELIDVLARSRNRFVLSTRYVARAGRLLREAPSVFYPIEMPPLTVAEVRDALPDSSEHRVEEELNELARAVHALTGGHPGYVRPLTDGLATLGDEASDPVGAMTALLMPGGALSNACRMTYEFRLLRARGYGALKAILDVLAREEPLTLTEIAQRLRRTPGSTKDYLTWLEDVDLVGMTQKRYSFTDPVLRLWVGLHCRPVPPAIDEVASEVQEFALARLPRGESMRAVVPGRRREPAGAPLSVAGRKPWEIVEID